MHRLSLFALVFSILTPAAFAQQERPSSVVETYGDWTVRCVPQGEATTCQMIQELAQGESGQRVLSILVDARDEESGEQPGTIVAPFGLRFADGVKLSIDEENVTDLAFSTCLPVGCVVPLTIDDDLAASLKAGETMGLTMVSIANGQQVNVELSLNGFSAAHRRLEALAASGS